MDELKTNDPSSYNQIGTLYKDDGSLKIFHCLEVKMPIITLLNTKHVAMKNISKLELFPLSPGDKIPVDDFLEKTFDFDDVTIEHLKGGLFQKLTYDKISIRNSEIFMIDSTAFNGIQVNKLELINNNITTIANRSFSNITINTFNLKATNIGKMKSGAFANIKIRGKINFFDIIKNDTW